MSDVTAALRRALECGTQPPSSIIHAATEFARILTGAHGVALGVRIKGKLVCRARSGDLAPELGSALVADSGISGECLRSAAILLCDDAGSDERVDHEACRALGIRSILAVPVRGRGGIVGILEAFSRSPVAFAQEAIQALRALTEIIETAHAREKNEREPVPIPPALYRSLLVKRKTPARQGQVALSHALNNHALDEDKLSRRVLGEPHSGRRFWVAAIALPVLLLGALGVWLSLHDPTPESAANDAQFQDSPVKVEPKPVARHTTFLKPEAGIALPRPRRPHPSGVLQKAAEIAPLREERREGGPSLPPEPEEVGEGFIRSASLDTTQPIPVRMVPSGNGTALTALATSAGTMPTLETRVSQGVTEARLIHEVQPVYPAQARIQRLSGAVILDVTIAEDGSVQNVGVMSGSPLLAASAVKAVRQWRYVPSLLDGRPAQVEKQITVVFRLP